jgi:hypothetical protein
MADFVHVAASSLPARLPAPQRNVPRAAAWPLHLADSRGRVGQAAALGPEGGRRAPLPVWRGGSRLR